MYSRLRSRALSLLGGHASAILLTKVHNRLHYYYRIDRVMSHGWCMQSTCRLCCHAANTPRILEHAFSCATSCTLMTTIIIDSLHTVNTVKNYRENVLKKLQKLRIFLTIKIARRKIIAKYKNSKISYILLPKYRNFLN